MSKYTLRELSTTESFDPTSIYPQAPFTQAQFYGDWQTYLDRNVRRFIVSTSEKVVAYFQVVTYPLIMGKSYFYIPYGPIVSNFDSGLLQFIKEELHKEAKSKNVVFVRLDFTPQISTAIAKGIFVNAPRYTYQSAYFQPRVEWYLGLEKNEDELLMSMHEKTRYSIRLSEKKGIKNEIIQNDFSRYFEKFYELMSETAKRNNFSLHPKEYYKNVFDNLSKTQSFLSVASYEGKILAIYVIVVYGGVANYVWGGSSNDERNRMPTYLAHWRAMCHAKSIGCKDYNFGGISPSEYKIYKKEMDSLTTFKKKFSGRELVHSELLDIITQPFWYHLYNFRKKIKTLGR